MNKHIDWNDETVPIGKRKTVFVKWLMQVKKVSANRAKAMANSRFGPSEASANHRKNRQDDIWRRHEQAGIRRFGHPAQYDTPISTRGPEDWAGLLNRLKSRKQNTNE